jgi:hypothetical protein
MTFGIWKLIALVQILLVLNLISNWPLLGWIGIRGPRPSGDFLLVFEQANCAHNLNLNWNTAAQQCDYIYGPFLFEIAKYFLPSQAIANMVTFVLASTLCALVMSIARDSLRKFLWGDALALVAIVLSPPIMLLVERGNIDLLMFVFAVAIAWCVAQRKYTLGFFVAILASGVKVYTVPLILLMLFFVPKKTKALLLFPSAVFIFWLSHKTLVSENVYPKGWFAFFGHNIWLEYWEAFTNQSINPILEVFLLVALLLASVAIVILILRRYPALWVVNTTTNPTGGSQAKSHVDQLMVYLTITTSVYFAGSSYDYRLVFFIPTLILIAGLMPQDLRSYALYLGVITLWFSFPASRLSILGDVLLQLWHTWFLCLLLFQLFGGKKLPMLAIIQKAFGRKLKST